MQLGFRMLFIANAAGRLPAVESFNIMFTYVAMDSLCWSSHSFYVDMLRVRRES